MKTQLVHGWRAVADRFLGVAKVGFEARPGFSGGGALIPATDVIGEQAGFSQEEHGNIDEWGRGFVGTGGFGEAGILLDGIEECVDGFVGINREGGDFITLVVLEGSGIDIPKHFEKVCHDFDNGAVDEAGVIVGDGLKEVRVDGFFDLLHRGAFKEIAFFEGFGGGVVDIFGQCNVVLHCGGGDVDVKWYIRACLKEAGVTNASDFISINAAAYGAIPFRTNLNSDNKDTTLSIIQVKKLQLSHYLV
jgi:hypothetical protein